MALQRHLTLGLVAMKQQSLYRGVANVYFPNYHGTRVQPTNSTPVQEQRHSNDQPPKAGHAEST